MEQSKPGCAESFRQQTQRIDLYAFIHKVLRAFICDTLTAPGSGYCADCIG